MCYLFIGNTLGWLNNSGFHGFSEMFYEYALNLAKNVSGFERRDDINPFWNIYVKIKLNCFYKPVRFNKNNIIKSIF